MGSPFHVGVLTKRRKYTHRGGEEDHGKVKHRPESCCYKSRNVSIPGSWKKR